MGHLKSKVNIWYGAKGLNASAFVLYRKLLKLELIIVAANAGNVFFLPLNSTKKS